MKKISKRNEVFLALFKSILWPAVKTTSNKKYDIPEETLKLMEEQRNNKESSIFYVGPHKSMWETIGLPYTISWHGGDIPFALMGNNLLKKETGRKEQVLKYFVERIGGIMVEREVNPHAAILSLIDSVSELLINKRNVMVFPEGTRSRDGLVHAFKPATFQGAIDAAIK
ncbi:MAG: 1-acyl-sn-glycerol-3-phosphate acyltransferase, partial [Candidatus Woesearchaeota archaeon]